MQQKKQKREIYLHALSKFGSGFLVILIVAISISATIYQSEKSSSKAVILQKQEQAAHQIADEYQEFIDQSIEETLILADSRLRNLASSQTSEAYQNIQEDFVAFAQISSTSFQVRLLDTTGKELVRVDKYGDEIQVTPEDRLQDKSSRDYVAEVRRAPKDSIVISNLDLNQEFGNIEIPYRPTLRVAIPIVNDNNERVGSIIINFAAIQAIEKAEKVAQREQVTSEIVNQNGYWINTDNPDKEWGFEFIDQVNTSFSYEHPEVWQAINSTDTFTTTEFEEEVFTAITVSPPTKVGERQVLGPAQIHVITSTTKQKISQATSGFRTTLISTNIVILLIIGSSLAIRARYVAEKQQSKQQIERLNNILTLINKMLRHDIAAKLTSVRSSLEVYNEFHEQESMDLAFEAIQSGLDQIKDMKELEVLVREGKLSHMGVEGVAKKVADEYQIQVNIRGNGIVMADQALRSVFENLIRNAITHGKTDKIDILITEKNDFVEIRLIDYGKGIPKKAQKKLFQEGFHHGATGNTGLGLYISKQTVERYGGTISFQENKPHGAIFIITIPRAA